MAARVLQLFDMSRGPLTRLVVRGMRLGDAVKTLDRDGDLPGGRAVLVLELD
jgi:hypothetical protein